MYECAGHAVLHKWVILRAAGGVANASRGFLKLCVAVLTASDPTPNFARELPAPPPLPDEDEDAASAAGALRRAPSAVSVAETQSVGALEDVDANLWLPGGIHRQPASLVLLVYRAEDLPPGAPFSHCPPAQLTAPSLSALSSLCSEPHAEEADLPLLQASLPLRRRARRHVDDASRSCCCCECECECEQCAGREAVGAGHRRLCSRECHDESSAQVDVDAAGWPEGSGALQWAERSRAADGTRAPQSHRVESGDSSTVPGAAPSSTRTACLVGGCRFLPLYLHLQSVSYLI